MSTATEARVQRANTAAFIAANPISLELIPTTRTKTAAGGFLGSDGQRRVAQTFRLVEQTHTFGNAPGRLRTPDGTQERVDYMLVGAYDSVMEVGDYWTDADGVRFEILELMPFNGYERRGQVRKYA